MTVEIVASCHGATMEEFLNSSLCQEIQKLLNECTSIHVPLDSFGGPCLSLQGSHSGIYTLSVRDDEFPGSSLIEVTDEKLLEKLRSVNGQFTCHGLPVFYYEHLMSTADYKVYVKTGKIPNAAGYHEAGR
jgi:hypothetical protein